MKIHGRGLTRSENAVLLSCLELKEVSLWSSRKPSLTSVGKKMVVSNSSTTAPSLHCSVPAPCFVSQCFCSAGYRRSSPNVPGVGAFPTLVKANWLNESLMSVYLLLSAALAWIMSTFLPLTLQESGLACSVWHVFRP